jgi:hypothetical protein
VRAVRLGDDGIARDLRLVTAAACVRLAPDRDADEEAERDDREREKVFGAQGSYRTPPGGRV